MPLPLVMDLQFSSGIHLLIRDCKSKEVYQYIDQLIYRPNIISICPIHREKNIDIFDVSKEIYRQIIFS